MKLTILDYSYIPLRRQTFYEILSDTIMNMCECVGDDALLIALQIEGLRIDAENSQIFAVVT